ncbi:MAG: GxxExxY protein [Desulfuromonadales bacterium]
MKEEVYQIVGAAIEVHRELGNGFLEAVYQDALSIEFRDRRIPFLPQPKLELYYKKRRLEKFYYPDFLCFDAIIVEIQALSRLTGNEDAQVINYLKVTGKKDRSLIFLRVSSCLSWIGF